MKKHKKQPIIAVLEAGNGFTRRMKLDDFVLKISIPFIYRVKISDSILSERYSMTSTATATFSCYKKNKKTAHYSIDNVGKITTN